MPRTNKSAKGKFWTQEADKALKEGLATGEIDPGLTAPDAYKLHPSFEEPGLDVFRRHFYSERKAFRAKNDVNAGLPKPSGKQFVIYSYCLLLM